MRFAISDNSLLMVFLLEECNGSCRHCVREEEPMAAGYRLSQTQLRQCLADCARLESLRWVHFSGGEPTLWSDGDRNLTDALLDVARAGYVPGFTTNGSRFEDYAACRDFFQKYVAAVDVPLRTFISVDTFHRNFDVGSCSCRSLDNVLRYRDTLPGHQQALLEVHPLAVISKSPASLLPAEMLRRYESLGAPFRVVPLRPKGRARLLAEECPNLDGDTEQDLGAFYRFRPRGAEVGTAPATNLVLVGKDYYLSEPEWRVVAKLGHLPEEVVRAYRKAGADVRDASEPQPTI
jgi:hypothetical protein